MFTNRDAKLNADDPSVTNARTPTAHTHGVTPSTVTSFPYTFVSSDIGKLIEANSGTAANVVIPAGLGAVGDFIVLCQKGEGAITVTGPAVTLRAAGAAFTTAAQNAVITMQQTATNEWLVYGHATT
jgi:hypothetical protein